MIKWREWPWPFWRGRWPAGWPGRCWRRSWQWPTRCPGTCHGPCPPWTGTWSTSGAVSETEQTQVTYIVNNYQIKTVDILYQKQKIHPPPSPKNPYYQYLNTVGCWICWKVLTIISREEWKEKGLSLFFNKQLIYWVKHTPIAYC